MENRNFLGSGMEISMEALLPFAFERKMERRRGETLR